eukprot:gene16718-22987_t
MEVNGEPRGERCAPRPSGKSFALCASPALPSPYNLFYGYAAKPLKIRVKHVGCVLQAPVSDRFYMSHFDSENYEKAMRVVEACPAPEKTLLPMELYEVPITVARFASLGGKCTSDDLFSADLSDDELRKQLNSLMEHEDAVRVASLWAFSGADECVPSDGSVDQAQLGGRLIQLVGQECAQLLVVGDANHNLSSSETHQSLFVEGVISFWNAEMAR